jgi:hypothetical protein
MVEAMHEASLSAGMTTETAKVRGC